MRLLSAERAAAALMVVLLVWHYSVLPLCVLLDQFIEGTIHADVVDNLLIRISVLEDPVHNAYNIDAVIYLFYIVVTQAQQRGENILVQRPLAVLVFMKLLILQ